MAGFRPAAKAAVERERERADSPEAAVLLQDDDIKDLPENFDWRNVDGENYVDSVISQDCGSCYAVATTSMIMSRIRVQSKNKQKPHLPYHQVLNCDRYNQGCAGGYPYLVEKYTQDFGLTTSGKCAKSSEALEAEEQQVVSPEMALEQESLMTSEHNKASLRQYDASVRVTKFGYIGGYYGGTRTAQMMRELHKNGPIVVGINGGFELMFYQSGVFVQTGAYEELKKQKGIRNDFEEVDHAVLVVGWGKDTNGDRHWIVKNSYGADWGEEGYFRIPLGGDRDGITSLTSAAIPVLGRSDFFSKHEEKHANAADADDVVPET